MASVVFKSTKGISSLVEIEEIFKILAENLIHNWERNNLGLDNVNKKEKRYDTIIKT